MNSSIKRTNFTRSLLRRYSRIRNTTEDFVVQELATKYEETRKLYKHFRDYLPHSFLLVIAGFMLTHFAWSSFHIFIVKSFWEAVEFYAMNILAIGTNIYVVRAAVLQVSRVRLFRRRLRVIEELIQSKE